MFKKISPILALNFVNILGFSILIPILPSIVETYQGSELLYGLLVSIYSMFQFFASPFMGHLSDIHGRRPVLILSQAGTFLSWLIFASAFFIPTIDLKIASLPVLVLLFARIFDGLTGGNTTVAYAYLSDITTKKEKTRAFGLVGATFGIGFLIGPILGSLSYGTKFQYAGTAALAATISLFTLLLLIFKLPESLPPEKRRKKLPRKILSELNLFARIKKLKLNEKLKQLFLLQFFFAMSLSGYTGIIILYLKQNYLISENNISLILIGFGLYAIFNQTTLIPKLAKKFGELKTYQLGYCTFIFAMAIISIPMPLWAFIACGYFASFAIDSCSTTFKAIISNSMPETKQGETQGLDEALLASGRATAPLITASIYALIQAKTFAVISLFLLLPILLVGLIKKLPSTHKYQVTQFDNIPFNEDL